MGWVTTSLRDMVLSARIHNLNFRLMEISQAKQSQQLSAGYALKAINNQKMDAIDKEDEQYSAYLATLDPTRADYQQLLRQADLQHEKRTNSLESIFQSMEASQTKRNNMKEQQLDQQQKIIEAQVQAASAEQEAVSKQMENDIKRTTIKLA